MISNTITLTVRHSIPHTPGAWRFSLSVVTQPGGSGNSAQFVTSLEDMSRYAGLLLVPAEGFGCGFFCPSGYFFCPVVTLVTFTGNLSNFKKK